MIRMVGARLLPYLLAFFSSLCIMVLELVASRLVAQHVGASLVVWTSVIGIILAGICLGNVFGGRLADRVEPRAVLGPLYGAGSMLVVGCLWMNAVVGQFPGLDEMPWDARTLLVVTLDFLIPATVLGMISPVVAKIAVQQAKRFGSALGDIYFWGAVGSIVGTFVAGFYLLSVAPTSTIVAFVAAGLALLAAAMPGPRGARLTALVAAVCLIVGALEAVSLIPTLPGFRLGNFKLNVVSVVGHAFALVTGLLGASRIWALRSQTEEPKVPRVEIPGIARASAERVSLADLALLSFLASLGFMTLEMVAGRLVTRHMGSSIYGWTSVIGILLGGLSIGNWIGGKAADHITSPRRASTFFLLASVFVLVILLMETPPTWLVRNPIDVLFHGAAPEPLAGDTGEFLGQATYMTGFPWWFRVLFWTGVVFLVPAIAMGTIGPVVAKLAVDRLWQRGKTGQAIGVVYAWGMVGSILGTFLTGFLLIDWLGTKGVILVLATTMALAATALGTIWHAAWAGIPLGLCVIAFAPAILPTGKPLGINVGAVRSYLMSHGLLWGLKDDPGDPQTVDGEIAYTDESNYYFIKVNNARDSEGRKRTLVLDNLIHGYIILGKPKRLDYDYEHIYALVTDRVMKKRNAEADPADRPVELNTLFLGGGSYTFPRYLQATYPRTSAEVAEIDPAVTRANHIALGLPWPEPAFPTPTLDQASGEEVVNFQKITLPIGPPGSEQSAKGYFDVINTFFPAYERDEKGGARVWLDGKAVDLGAYNSEESRKKYIESVRHWYDTSPYRIHTVWGDARQYAVKHQDKTFDIVYGDAFNDFSVPWHLTTKEFNDLLANMMSPDGVYMINIIDVYDSDHHAAAGGPMLELSDRVAAAVRSGGWQGTKSATTLSDDIADFVASNTFEPHWQRFGGFVEQIPESSDKPFEKPSWTKALGALDTVEGPKPPVDSDIKSSVEAVIINSRAAEVLSSLDKIRSSLLRNARSEDPANVGVVFVVEAMDAARSEAAKRTRPSQRAQELDQLLAACQEVAERMANGPPDTLLERLGAGINSLEAELNAKTLSPERVDILRGLIDGIRRAGEEAPANDEGADAGAPPSGGVVAVNAAAKAAKEFGNVRVQLVKQVKEVEARSAHDTELAASVAQTVSKYLNDRDAWYQAAIDAVERSRRIGMFVGAWVNTARLTFGENVYVFGTDSEAGSGDRETFVIVASKQPLDVQDLGRRPGDPEFYVGERRTTPEPYSQKHLDALRIRSRGIVLTDDYAPVENLLAPVAETRAKH